MEEEKNMYLSKNNFEKVNNNKKLKGIMFETKTFEVA